MLGGSDVTRPRIIPNKRAMTITNDLPKGNLDKIEKVT